jgi:phosphoribosylformylglycinamidine synthase subunit PurS
MAAYEADVRVHLKPGALDPQGQAVAAGLRALGYAEVTDVRVGKHLRVRLEAVSAAEARAAVDRMCRELLANPVMETYAFDVRSAVPGAAAGV